MFYGFVITEGGNRLLAKMVAGQTLELSRVVMDKGTAESAEAARKLTAPIDPGPEGTSAAPIADGATVNMIAEYRTDLNGGLAEGFWIGGFAIYARDPAGGDDVMIYYGSLGDAKQYASAYTPGTAPDVRRYPVSITVTAGVTATVVYPAEAWMTAQDVADYFNNTLGPELEASLTALIGAHDADPEAHGGLRAKIQANTDAAATALAAANAAKLDAAGAVTAAGNAQQTAEAALEAIAKLAHTIDATPSQNGGLTFTGREQSPVWNSYNPETLTMGGVTTGSDAGTYTATFTPVEGYAWSDGTTTARSVPWVIGRAAIADVPSQSGALTYTGAALSPAWSNYDTVKMTLGGVTSGTNAGSYHAIFTPTSNYQWPDVGTAAKTVAWSIGKAAGSLSLDKTSMTLTNGALTGTITVTRAGDGAITATSSKTSVATVSVSGTTVAVTGKGYGSATITVSVAAGTNHNAPANKTCGVTAKIYSTALNANTWAQIGGASDAGAAASIWNVGDVKTITINGTVGSYTFSNVTVDAFILGFNHNSSREGANKIHFQIGKIGGKLVALCDNQYNTGQSGNGYFNMNPNNSNSGGWGDSYMRKTLLGNIHAPNVALSGSLMAALPIDLRVVMKSCAKTNVESANTVVGVADYLFLLSEWEYHGATTYADSVERNYHAQYDYYKAGNSKVHYKHNATGTTAFVWCRSVYSGGSNSFCLVNTNGSAISSNASNSYGVAPGFCV